MMMPGGLSRSISSVDSDISDTMHMPCSTVPHAALPAAPPAVPVSASYSREVPYVLLQQQQPVQLLPAQQQLVPLQAAPQQQQPPPKVVYMMSNNTAMQLPAQPGIICAAQAMPAVAQEASCEYVMCQPLPQPPPPQQQQQQLLPGWGEPGVKVEAPAPLLYTVGQYVLQATNCAACPAAAAAAGVSAGPTPCSAVRVI
jgi:hypothetical protein